MMFKFCSTASLVVSLLTPGCDSHGLMEDPPSRNWICGAVTKPYQVDNGVAEHMECGTAFDFQSNPGGYQFMSVLTHDVGRVGVTNTNNVCGFDSETWSGGSTPWDAPMDWPTTPATSGLQEIKWNIFWGPHFSDTEEFRYWITKEDFVFDSTRALTWDDFESEAFCYLTYDDNNPTGNPNVIPDVGATTFRTICDVPERSGHHVIYGEWGRNPWTYERFHGCIDLDFNGGAPPTPPSPPSPTSPTPTPVTADLVLSPSVSTIAGAGSITLDASGSAGAGLSYSWSVTTNSGDDSLYTIDDSQAATTTLSFGDPDATRSLMVMVTVSNTEGSSTESTTIIHSPSTTSGSQWVDLGPLTDTSQDLASDTIVSVRVVDGNGVDTYYPDPAFTVDNSNRWATNWPFRLSEAIPSGAPIAVGVLDASNDNVVGAWSGTANHIYALVGNNINSAYLLLEDPAPPGGGGGGGGGGGECSISFQGGCNPWWCGLNVGFDTATITLDFSESGLDLSALSIQNGAFTVTRSGQTLLLTKQGWVSESSPGYLGFNGNNVAALASFSLPNCV